MAIKYDSQGVVSKSEQHQSAASAAVASLGTDVDFNPYDYINVSDYPMTRRGKAKYQEDLARLLYIAQIEQENRMNEYNSPSAQAARMRAAGLNPDILGVENHGATNVAGYQGNPIEGIPSNMDMVTNLIGVVSSVGSMVSAFMSGVPELESKNIQNIGNSISSAGSLWSLFDSAGTLLGAESYPNMMADLLPSLPRRYRKRIQKAYVRFLESSGGKASFNRSLASQFNSEGELSRSRVNPFNHKIDDDTWSKIWQPYYDGIVQAAQQFLAEGKSATSKAEADELTTEMFRELKKPLQSVFRNVDKFIGETSFSGLIKAAIGAAILQYLPL